VIASAIVAAADNDVIGRDGDLPWHLSADLRRFRRLTTGHVVVMGRVTYESILGRLGHPLPDRTSVVVTSTLPAPADERVRLAGSVAAGLRLAASLTAAAGGSEFFVIGGESVYRQALPSLGRVYLTRVHQAVEGDRGMPDGWLTGFKLVGGEPGTEPATGMRYEFLDYERAPR
jgi:dihydrofolate reductase